MANRVARTLITDGYVPIPGLIGDPGLSVLRSHVRALEPRMPPDRQVPGAPCEYGDPILDGLLEVLRSPVGRLAGAALYPTYSFVRVYRRGDVLPRHVDRPACELSLSLSLELRGPTEWPLWIEGPRGPSRVVLAPGDAVLYHGTTCPHWREVFDGEAMSQVFLHYVRVDGPYAGWRFDGRPGLLTAPRDVEDLLARSIREPVEAP